MKFLVTGAAGFIGSHLVDRLLADRHQVFGVDDFSNGKLANLEKALQHPNFQFIEDNFVNCVDQIWDADVVYHLAATGSVPRSIEMPNLTFQNNVGNFHELLLTMRLSTSKRLIYASSSSVYGGGSQHPNPQSPYALSKLVGEMYAEQYAKRFGIHATGLRFFNVYGPRQRHDTEFAAVIPRILHSDPICINQPGTQKRDFTYVDDVVEALVLALNCEEKFGVYDVGFGESRSVMEAVDILRKLLPERTFNIQMADRRPGDVLFSRCNNQATKEKLGWEPKFNLEDGLKRMIA